jgi:hypothetical protein
MKKSGANDIRRFGSHATIVVIAGSRWGALRQPHDLDGFNSRLARLE